MSRPSHGLEKPLEPGRQQEIVGRKNRRGCMEYLPADVIATCQQHFCKRVNNHIFGLQIGSQILPTICWMCMLGVKDYCLPACCRFGINRLSQVKGFQLLVIIFIVRMGDLGWVCLAYLVVHLLHSLIYHSCAENYVHKDASIW